MADPIDPIASARGPRTVLPKRFYQRAAAEARDGAYVIVLDGRPLRTPARKLLALPDVALAEAVAAEWTAQGEHIDPATMPVTRIVNSAIESVAGEMEAVADEIMRFAGSDLVCYRAAGPAPLLAEQARAWDPVLDWAREALGARFILGEGVMFVAQPAAALAALRAGLMACTGQGQPAPFRLAGLSVMTTLTGSALIALQCGYGATSIADGWAAAHIDEDFQARMWGADPEADSRRAARLCEMQAAGRVLGM